MRNNKKGFTLIEMLAVIAIIAVLVAIIVPAIGSSTEKAKAATDAANLRSVLSLLNIHVVNGDKTVDEIINDCANPTSKIPENFIKMDFFMIGPLPAVRNGNPHCALF